MELPDRGEVPRRTIQTQRGGLFGRWIEQRHVHAAMLAPEAEEAQAAVLQFAPREDPCRTIDRRARGATMRVDALASADELLKRCHRVFLSRAMPRLAGTRQPAAPADKGRWPAPARNARSAARKRL